MAEPNLEGRTHDGENLAEAIDRLGDDFEDPFDKHAKSRGRWGWVDLVLGHAVTNVAVSAARERPRWFGHAAIYGTAAVAVLVAALLLWIYLLSSTG